MATWASFRTYLAAMWTLPLEIRERDVHTSECWSVQSSLSQALGDLNALMNQKTPVRLTALRYVFSEAQCYDSRDRIYGALDMLVRSDARIVGVPDYDRSVSDIYFDVAQRYLQRSGYTQLLQQYSLEENTDKSIPTWAPDWSRLLPILCDLPGTASMNWTAPISFADTSLTRRSTESILSIYGVPGLVVTHLGPVVPRDLPRDLTRLQSILSGLLPAACLENLDTPCSGGQPAMTVIEQYVSVLCADRFQERYRPPHMRLTPFLSAVSVLRKWLQLKSAADFDAYINGLGHLPQDGPEMSFIRTVSATLAGRRLALGPSKEVMLLPASARVGDRVCIVFGGTVPVLLRPGVPTDTIQDAKYRVVGPCFIGDMQYGEALLGPLPPGVTKVYDVQTEHDIWLDSATDGIVATGDPRYESFFSRLPEEVARDLHERQTKSRDFYFELTSADLDILRHHRPEVVATGGDIQEFHLI